MTLDELDRLAAEKVMGFRRVRQFWRDGDLEVYTVEPDLQKALHWQPTRDISQAWECLEKFEKFTVIKWELPHIGKYRAEANDDLLSSGETAPEVIVRACLKAKGIDV